MEIIRFAELAFWENSACMSMSIDMTVNGYIIVNGDKSWN